MNVVYLSLGSNQGDRMMYLKKAAEAIQIEIGNIITVSALYETEPWGFYSNEGFINQVISAQTDLSVYQVLDKILFIEQNLGRERFRNPITYSDRTIDIDILIYSGIILESHDLTVPHKLMHDRKFVLEPLCEIAPDLIHPLLSETVRNLLLNCQDRTMVRKVGAEGALIELV